MRLKGMFSGIINAVFVAFFIGNLIFIPVLGEEGKMVDPNSEGFVVVNDAKHYYRIEGQGKPLIVLHGGPGLSCEYFLPHLESLADENRLIFYDQRASGSSSKDVPPESINPGTFVEDLEGIRQEFDLDKVRLLGHSWGGLLALRYALRYPERTERLVLVDSAPPNSELDEVNFKAREERRSEADVKKIQEIMASEAFQRLEPQAVKNYFMVSEKVKFFKAEMMSGMRLSLDGPKLQKLVWVGQLMNPHLAQYDITEELSAISCPLLVIHGDYDTIPVESARIIHEQVKGSRLLVIEKCGHFPFIEAPEVFTREVKAFLEEGNGR